MQETLAITIDIAAGEERAGGREPEPLDLLVDGGILLDVGVRARDVGLGLVVIEVADEILDGVVGEKLLELAVELRGERLVVRDDQRGPVDVADDVRDGERLAGAGHAQQGLVPVAGLDGFGQLGNRLRLVALGLVIGSEFKLHPTSLTRGAKARREIRCGVADYSLFRALAKKSAKIESRSTWRAIWIG